MRTSNFAPLLLLAACGQPEQDRARAEEARALQDAPKFFCATGEGDLRAECTAERTRSDRGWTLTLRHPDGHFRRLLVSEDGQTVTVADGAQPAVVTRTGEQFEVRVGDDRYRLPVTR